MDPDMGDFIQFLTTDTAKTYLMATYVDEAKALYYGDISYMGWWDNEKMGEDDGRLDDMKIDIGTAFLTLFQSGNTIKFNYSGEVKDGECEVNIPAGTRAPFLCNCLPSTYKLGRVKVSGMDPDMGDFIQFLTTDTAKTYLMATYVDEAKALYYGDISYMGWWDNEKMGEDDGRLDDMDFEAGVGFLGLLQSGNAMTFTFPNLLAK